MTFKVPACIVSFLLLFEVCYTCPSTCVCKWKNGKQTVECNEKGLLAIPEGMDPGTQVLEFSGNNLHSLSKQKFLSMDLTNLQRIYLSRCKIVSVDDRTFKGLTNLVELDLSGNLLESVPTATFIDCPSLMRLTLSSNPIKILRRLAFNHLSYLNALELSRCELSTIEEQAFKGLTCLERLYLDNNKLTTLPGSELLPESLRSVELTGNQWECDCNIFSFRLWLLESKMPLSVEPACYGPLRLIGRPIKSVPESNLACLPEVSPTTFYLEISEGKNISLLCQVHAIPEAKVSWWFQGQLLQNDTMVAPGVHLMYYIEEGGKEKRSELFIHNINSEDNGTFVCSAENAAGAVLSNFTIRIIIKQQTIYPQNSIPFEYILILASSVTVLILTIIICQIVVCAMKRNRANKYGRKPKGSILNDSVKDSLFKESADNSDTKSGSNFCLADHQQEMMLYNSHPCDELLNAMTPAVDCNQVKSPASLRRYHLEQNPDLINDAKSVGRRCEGDTERKNESHPEYGSSILKLSNETQLEFYRTTADVHLTPIGLLRSEDGSAQISGNFYRTLPHPRATRRHSAANPQSRYSREAEFLSRSIRPASYEHYCADVRYTADGYPAPLVDAAFIPSPPEGYKTDSAPCCSGPLIEWPPRVPANLQDGVSKRCVGAQTESEDCKPNNSKPCNKTLCNVKVYEALTESPDEGYEGDCADSNTC